MSDQIKIEEISDGVRCISWTTNINSWNGETKKDFKLNNVQKCITNFEMSWVYSTEDYYRWSRYSMTGKFIKLCLKEMDDDTSETTSGSTHSNDPCDQKKIISDYYRQPHAVWITIDGGNLLRGSTNKIILKKVATSEEKILGLWESQLVCFTPTSTIFTFKYFIQFKTFGISEMNAITHVSNYLFLEQNHCDVQFHFAGAQNIGGHVSILAARSPVFAAMFKYDMQESKTGQVVIKDISRDIFYHLLHYVYSGRTPTPMTETTAQLLFAAADKYDLEDLKEECIRFLLTCVTETTANKLFEMAAKYHIDELKEECVRTLLLDIQMNNVLSMLIWSHIHSVEKIKNAALNVVAKNGKAICLSEDYEKMMRRHPDLCLEATRHMWP
jgi:speckle-type POZ protein